MTGPRVRPPQPTQARFPSPQANQAHYQQPASPRLDSTGLCVRSLPSPQPSQAQRPNQARFAPLPSPQANQAHCSYQKPASQGIGQQQQHGQTQQGIARYQGPRLDSTKSRLSSLFNWNSNSVVGTKRKSKSSCYKKKLQTWSHTFVCLSSVNQEFVPDGQERASLQIAGLGEKRITLSAFADAQDIYHELSFQFPKLSNAGGFELMRIPEGGGKLLDVVAAPDSGYTVSYLKAVIHHAKIYIRPLQQNLSLDPVQDEVCYS